jgi:ribose transport system permease protein
VSVPTRTDDPATEPGPGAERLPPSSRWVPTLSFHGGVAFLERFALLGLLIALGIFFSVYSGTSGVFLTSDNMQSLFTDLVVISTVLAVASIFPLICGQYDLSVGATAGLSSIVAAAAAGSHGWPLLLAILLALVAGAVVGAVNGALVAAAGINPLIVTLGTSSVLAGLVSLYTNDQTLSSNIPGTLTNLSSSKLVGIPVAVIIAAVIALAMHYVLASRPYGRRLLSVGSSQNAARLVGLSVGRLIFSSFVISGLLSAAGGILILGISGTASPQVGPDYTLPALSAAFLGATAILPGKFNVPGTVLGVVFVSVSVNGLTLAGAASWVSPTFDGVALIVAVGITRLIASRRSRPR